MTASWTIHFSDIRITITIGGNQVICFSDNSGLVRNILLGRVLIVSRVRDIILLVFHPDFVLAAVFYSVIIPLKFFFVVW